MRGTKTIMYYKKMEKNMLSRVKIGVALVLVIIGLGISGYSINNMQADEKISPLETINISEIQQISHTLGDDSAPIKLIEFGDFQCPFCGEWYQETKPTFDKEYISTGKVQLIFVDYPFLGEDSYPTAYASYCAEEQGMYWEFHEIVYLNQGEMNDGWAQSDNIRDLSEQAELDMEAFDQCMSSTNHKEQLDRNIAIGNENSVNQTPTFMIISATDSQKIEGKQPIAIFDKVIQEMIN